MLKGPIVDIEIEELGEGVDLIVLIELELTELDLALDVLHPVFRFLLALEGFANGGIAFDADNGSPGVAVLEFSFEYRHAQPSTVCAD